MQSQTINIDFARTTTFKKFATITPTIKGKVRMQIEFKGVGSGEPYDEHPFNMEIRQIDGTVIYSANTFAGLRNIDLDLDFFKTYELYFKNNDPGGGWIHFVPTQITCTYLVRQDYIIMKGV